MSSRFILPFADVGSGITPSSGAKLFFFFFATTSPKDTFSDQLSTPTPNANPVVANAKGVFPDIYIEGAYSVTLQDKNGKQIFGGATVLSTGASGENVGVFTLAEAVANTAAQDGQIVQITDRDNGQFTYKTGLTPNAMNIVAADKATLDLDLIIGEKLMLPQIGTPTDGTGNPTPFIEHAFTLRDTVDGGGSNNFYDITEVIGLPSNSIYSDGVKRLTGDWCTFHPSVLGEAIFTSVTAKADPDSTANLFTAKWEFDHINYVQKGYLNDNTLPSFDGRIFNGDRLYNIKVHHNNFVAIERVVDSRRKKGTDSFLEEGYLQSFFLEDNYFAYCSFIVQYSYGFNVGFTRNIAETCLWGWHSVFDAGTLLTGRFIDNLFEGIGVYLRIPSAKGCVLHGAHLEMGNAPAASYLASEALIDFSPVGPFSAAEISRQWDIRGVFGSVPLIYDGDDFEFSLISTTNASFPNIKSPEITFSALSYRAEHLVFSQGSEVGSPSEASPNLLKNANFQINQNETTPTTNIVTGKEIDLWDMRTAANAAAATYQVGFNKGGAYGGSLSMTLAGTTKSHFITQRIPMGRDIINGIGGYGGNRAFVTINMDLPSQTLVRVQLAYSRDSDGVDFGSANQFILLEAGLRNNHFALDMPDTTRTDDEDYSLVCQVTFNGPGGDGTAAPVGTYEVYFVKVEFNSVFATPFVANDFESDLHAARHVYYRPSGGVESIKDIGGQNTLQATSKTLPFTNMSAATYTITYDSIDTYLANVPTNIVTGGLVSFDGSTLAVEHTAGATFNGYDKINGLTITAD